MKINKFIWLAFVLSVSFICILFMIDYQTTNDKLVDSYVKISNQKTESKSSENKKIKMFSEESSEDGSITITTTDSGTFGDLAQGSLSEKFTSEGDKTTNKKVNDGSYDLDNGADTDPYKNPNQDDNSNNIDADLYQLLVDGGFDSGLAKRVATLYYYIEPTEYGAKAALAIGACSCCEGDAGLFEKTGGYRKGNGYPWSGYDDAYKLFYEWCKQYNDMDETSGGTVLPKSWLNLKSKDKGKWVYARMFKLSGEIISSQKDAEDYNECCEYIYEQIKESPYNYDGSVLEGFGIGFVQFSGVRRDYILKRYMSSTDFSDSSNWAMEISAHIDMFNNISSFSKDTSPSIYDVRHLREGFIGASEKSTPSESTRIMFSKFVYGWGTPSEALVSMRTDKMEQIYKIIKGTKYDAWS